MEPELVLPEDFRDYAWEVEAKIDGPADGRVTSAGVIGTGSGAWLDEPPDAVVSTVAEIRRLAITWLDTVLRNGR